MSIFEYDKEEEERKLRKAEFEAGEQSGIQKGIQKERLKIVQLLAGRGMSVTEIADILKASEKNITEMIKK